MLRLLIALTTIGVVGSATNGQVPRVQPARVDEDTLVELQTQLQLVKADTELDEASKAKAIDAYTQAIAAAKSTASFQSKAADFTQGIEKIQPELSKLTSEIAKPRQTPQVDGAKSLKEMDRLVQQKTAELEAARRQVEACVQAIAAREQRLLEIPKATAEANARLSNLDTETSAETGGETPEVTAATAEQSKLRRAHIRSEIDALKAENSWHLASGELLQLRREVAKQVENASQVELEMWQQMARQKRETEVDRGVRMASDYLKGFRESRSKHPLLPLAEENEVSAIARQKMKTTLRSVSSDQDRIQKQFQKLQQQFERARKEAEAQSTITQSLGEVLREKRAELRSLQNVIPDAKVLGQQVSETRLQLYLLREEEIEYEDLEAVTNRKMNEMGIGRGLRSETQEQLAFRKALVKGLRIDTEALFQVLARLESTSETLLQLSQDYATFIDERVLWIQSADFFSGAQAGQTVSSLMELLSPTRWLRSSAELLTGIRRQPVIPIVGSLLLIPFFFLGFSMRRALREIGEKAQSRSCRDFGLTIRASVITVGIALAWPALLYTSGFWMKSSGLGDTDFLPSLGAGLVSAAIALFALELCQQSARANGLMVSHFRVAPTAASVLRQNLRWLVLILVPLIALESAITAFGNPIVEQSLGRIVFVMTMMVLMYFLFRIGHPRSGTMQGFLARRSDSVLFKTRYPWFLLLLAVPITLAVLSLIGYHFTATQLAARLVSTCFLALSLWFAQSLVLRWVVLSRRRLAMEQARARLAKASEQTDTGPGSAEAQANLEEIDLASVDLQTRRLVRALTVVIGVFAFWSLWADVLPALSGIGDYQAWEVSASAAVASDTPRGDESKAALVKTEVVTYGNVAKAIAIVVAMLLAMRDVPGLLELVLLQRLPLDIALRFAITTLTRYVIFVIGLAWALSTIEIGWSKVQWLVAGVSVGLGFGLQEIFANFVSGLIILFERPLRSGDIVTIDGVTGTVKSVRMRATIIQDLDRKDFVVPNKDFITGRLLNWTLSDEVSRIVLRVGVAYGTDTDSAKELMLAAATEQEQICEDPPPQVIFEEFGDSSLNLTLRCFISLQNMPSRLSIIDQLHSKIDKSFRNANIEIPFPQRDLHVRSSDVELPGVSPDNLDAYGLKKRR